MDSTADSPRPADLRSHDTLVMQQVTGFMSNDFDILDGAGEHAVGHVTTTGSGVARFFSGARSLRVADADGTPLLRVEDPPGIGVDRFELSAPDGTPVAELRGRFSVFSTKVSMTLAVGAEPELHGDMLGLDYEFRYGEAVAARAAREWAGFSRGFLGHSRYVLAFDPTVPPPLRLAIVGGCIVLDLIRAKRSRSSG
ncbi:LURP-one-related/scramblase family protein [Brachybacterium atlanticum]|uniref:LURP-one-related/scramblase family protein n=1 Tax=Brachybacterium atlanticum TaxID=2911888 RepID=UPI0021E0C02B|nr:hypothetical protein [Brachybacterium atlanticum]